MPKEYRLTAYLVSYNVLRIKPSTFVPDFVVAICYFFSINCFKNALLVNIHGEVKEEFNSFLLFLCYTLCICGR